MNNLNKKTLIQVAVTLVCFLGSGLVLYNGYFKNTAKPVVNVTPAVMGGPGQKPMDGSPAASGAPVASGGTPAKKIDQILPNGNTLDFSVLDRPNVQYGTTLYENFVNDSELGISVNDIVEPKPITVSPTR